MRFGLNSQIAENGEKIKKGAPKILFYRLCCTHRITKNLTLLATSIFVLRQYADTELSRVRLR
jgi:hypothetical protein